MESAAQKIVGNNGGISGVTQQPIEVCPVLGHALWRMVRRRCRRPIANNLVDLSAGGSVIPLVQFSNQDASVAGSALTAVVGPGSVAIIEAVAVFAAADRAGAVLVMQEPGVYAELRQDFPASDGARSLSCSRSCCFRSRLGVCDISAFRPRPHLRGGRFRRGWWLNPRRRGPHTEFFLVSM